MSSIFAGSFLRNGPATSCSAWCSPFHRHRAAVRSKLSPNIGVEVVGDRQLLRLFEGPQRLLRVLPEPSFDLAWREVRPVEQDLQPDPRRGRLLVGQGLLRGPGRVDRGRLHFGGKRGPRDARQHKADDDASGRHMSAWLAVALVDHFRSAGACAFALLASGLFAS